MDNLYANCVKILVVCKNYYANLVNGQCYIPRCGVIHKFSDFEDRP